MSIRPVDMQTILPKAAEVTRLHNIDSQRPETEAQRFAAQLQKQVEHEQRHVASSHKSEGNGIDKDGSNRGKYSGQKRKKEEKGKKDQETVLSEHKGLFDITV